MAALSKPAGPKKKILPNKPYFYSIGRINCIAGITPASGCRLKKDAAKNAATALAFTTENGRTTSKDADTTETKDGTIRTPGAAEVEITATSILAKGDTLIDSLEDAMINDELVEIWEANLDEPASSGSNKFKGKYFQGYVTELEKTSNAEDMVEVSITFGVNGTGEKGDVTVTAAQQEVAAYVFTDTTKTGA